MENKDPKESLSQQSTAEESKAPLTIEDLTDQASQDSDRLENGDATTKKGKESIEDAVAARKETQEGETPKSIRDIALDIAEPFRLPKIERSTKKNPIPRADKASSKAYPSLSSAGKPTGESRIEGPQASDPSADAVHVIMPGDPPIASEKDREILTGEAAPLVLIQPEQRLRMQDENNVSTGLPSYQAPVRKEPVKDKKTEGNLFARLFSFGKKEEADTEEPAKDSPTVAEEAARPESPPSRLEDSTDRPRDQVFPESQEAPASTAEVETPAPETDPTSETGHQADDRPEEVHQSREATAEWELEQALEAAGIDPAISTCEELRQLEAQLRDGKSPWMQEQNVIIERKPALQLIQGLTALCDNQAGEGFEDELFDTLASSSHIEEGDFKPMYRVKSRAKSILEDATKQADHILNDARIVSNKLLRDTDAKIQEKYDQADIEIEQRLTSSKEASVKRLTEAREELTSSRKQSVDILNLYMDKAEDDYQGYWERAEQTLMASLLRSDQVLEKAATIYQKELIAIGEDLEVLRNILEDLARKRP